MPSGEKSFKKEYRYQISVFGAYTNLFIAVGPRMVLNPIRIFDGSFGGPTLYQNPHFISPNEVRNTIHFSF